MIFNYDFCPVTERKSFSFRTYNSIDLDSLRADLSQLPLITAPAFVHQDQVDSGFACRLVSGDPWRRGVARPVED
jgi:hypothetical protein